MNDNLLRRSGAVPVQILVAGLVLLLGAGLTYYFWWQSQNRARQGPLLTQEARDYLPYLDLSDVDMKAEESFLEHTLVTIEGKITNRGEKTVTLVQINCLFRDPHGVETAREPAVIVGRKEGPLAAGETQPFRLAFDTIPPEWNQVMPSLFVEQIQFE